MMKHHALVVVVRGGDGTDPPREMDAAWAQVADALRDIDDVRMVGVPWLVEPAEVQIADGDGLFDTLSCIEQRKVE